jgi:CubicO group peptidase (beta-lactamase class C family)
MKSKKVFLFMLLMLGVVVFLLVVQVNSEAGEVSKDFKEKILEKVQKIMDNGEIPGLSLVVIKGNKQTYTNGFGNADLEKKIPVTKDTLFELCSCSKSFTALAIIQLAKKGSIDLNDPISRYFPWFHVKYRGNKYDITINQLLHHTSGIPWNTFSKIPQGNSEGALEETTRLIVGTELENIPGEQVVYCNTNYDIIGAVIEKVSGMTFEGYMLENIFKPLGLSNTSVGQKRNDPNMAAGYKLGFNSPRRFVSPFYRGNSPSAYVVTNAVDMERFLKIQLEMIDTDLRELVEASHKIDSVLSNSRSSSQKYAKGWMVVDNGSELLASGSNPNYTAYIALRPEDNMAVAVLANSNSSDTSNLGKNLLNLLLGKELEEKHSFDIGYDQFFSMVSIVMGILIIIELFYLISIAIDAFKCRRQFETLNKKKCLYIIGFLLGSTIIGYVIYSIPKVLFGFSWEAALVWNAISFPVAIIFISISLFLGNFLYFAILMFPKNIKNFFVCNTLNS